MNDDIATSTPALTRNWCTSAWDSPASRSPNCELAEMVDWQRMWRRSVLTYRTRRRLRVPLNFECASTAKALGR